MCFKSEPWFCNQTHLKSHSHHKAQELIILDLLLICIETRGYSRKSTLVVHLMIPNLQNLLYLDNKHYDRPFVCSVYSCCWSLALDCWRHKVNERANGVVLGCYCDDDDFNIPTTEWLLLTKNSLSLWNYDRNEQMKHFQCKMRGNFCRITQCGFLWYVLFVLGACEAQ